MHPKTQLLRIVSVDGVATIDATGKINGRGVYLCPDKECIQRALKNKSFQKVNGFSLEPVAEQLEQIANGQG